MKVDVIIALGNVPPELLVILRQQIVEVVGFLVVFIYPLAERKFVNLFAARHITGDEKHKIINSHAQAAFLMVSIVFAAGAFTGVVKNSGMLASMTDALVSIIPTSMGTFIAPIVGLFSVPLSLLFDPDSYYYGVMPVIANAVSAMGGNALAVAKASIMGQMTLGFPLSPLTGATFLLLGLSGQDLGDHQKHTLPYAWAASAIMVAVGCVACGLLF